MKNTEDVEIFLFEEYAFSLKIFIDDFFLLFNGFWLTVDLLKDDSHEVHLASGKGLHFFNALLKRRFIYWSLEALNDLFIIQELLFLKLSLYLLGVKVLQRIRNKVKVLIWLIQHHEGVVGLGWDQVIWQTVLEFFRGIDHLVIL
jgi:hypothetical protein